MLCLHFYRVLLMTAPEIVVEAKAPLAQIDFKFVVLLRLFCDLLGKIRLVSEQLQAVSLDTAKAVELVQNLTECLTKLCLTDDFTDCLFEQAEAQSRDCDIEIIFSDTVRRSRKNLQKVKQLSCFGDSWSAQ